MAWPPTIHQDVQNEVAFLRPDSTNKTLYVSTAGNDSNTGLSWGAAKLTLSAAFSALGFGPGTIEIGAGTFTASGLVPNFGQVLRGRSRYGTFIQLGSTGTLLNMTSLSNIRFESLCFSFASSSVTGTLALMSNAFTCDFVDCRFLGTGTTGQVGVNLAANAGDSQFVQCYWENLDVGVQNDSTVNHWIGCVFTTHPTAAVRSGDNTGAGATFTDCTFRGSGAAYINITGRSQSWHIKGCWFDGGGATTGVTVGSGTFGPWLFSMTDCPSILGSTSSLVINAAQMVAIHGCVFGNAGTSPTDLTVNATNAPKGSLFSCFSLQGTNLSAAVPAAWTKG